MDLSSIVYVLIIIVVLYYFISWFSATSVSLSKINEAHVAQIIDNTKTNTKKTNFAYSIWVNVSSWSGDSDFGREKIIFAKSSTTPALDTNKSFNPNSDTILSMSLDKHENNVKIKVAYQPDTGGSAIKHHTCTVYNVPLQKWVNLIISFDTRVLDVYMNGKLVKTCIIENVPYIGTGDATYNVHLTPAGGFTGETANFRFFKNSVNPQEAWEIYKQGFASGLLSGLLNKYKMKVAFLKDDTEFTSFQI